MKIIFSRKSKFEYKFKEIKFIKTNENDKNQNSLILKKQSIIFLFTKDSEDIEEKSDDITIDDHSTHNIIIHGKIVSFSTHNELDINQ